MHTQCHMDLHEMAYMHTYTRHCSVMNKHAHITRVHKNHFKMVNGCRIDTGLCKKGLSKKDSPKTLGTRVICEIGKGQDRQRSRQA